MKKSLSLVLVMLMIIIMGCVGCHVESNQNDDSIFEFELPCGFVIADISDKECSIINEAGLCVGGFVVTDLKLKDIKGTDSIILPQYLNKFHEGSEYISWSGDNAKNPTKHVKQFVSEGNSTLTKELYHVFFERNSRVYDMWLDTQMIDSNTVLEFVSVSVE